MAIINVDKFLGSGGASYLSDLLEAGTRTVTNNEAFSTTGDLVNVAGKGLFGMIVNNNNYTYNVTITCDGVTMTGTVYHLQRAFGVIESEGSQVKYGLQIPFETSLRVTCNNVGAGIGGARSKYTLIM